MPKSAVKTMLWVWMALVYAFMMCPILIVVVLSFNTAEFSTFPIRTWGFRWFVELAHDTVITSSLWTSFLLASFSSLIAILIGTAAAYALARYDIKTKGAVRTLLALPILVPHVILGVGLLLMFRLFGINRSFAMLVVGHVVLTLPFVVLTVGHRLQAIPRVYEEAALTLGANRFQTFTSTVLPLMYPAVFAGLVLAFVMSFDEVTATLFWLPANTQTVQTAIFSILQVEISPKVNALASVLIALTVLALGLAMLLRTKPASRA